MFSLGVAAFCAQAQPLDPPLCERTPGIQAAILELTPAYDDCADFPVAVLRNATELNAEQRQIHGLKAGDFNDADRLVVLNLWGNRLRELPEDVFAGLGDTLEELNLGSNRLQTLPKDVFDGLDSLAILTLKDNRLQSLDSRQFEELGGLRRLYLQNNRLEHLPRRMFSGLDLNPVKSGSSRRGGLRLDGNPGAPFDLPVEIRTGLQAVSTGAGEWRLNKVFAYIRHAAPVDLNIAWSRTRSGTRVLRDLPTRIPAGLRAVSEDDSDLSGVVILDFGTLTLGLTPTAASPEFSFGGSECDGGPCYAGFEFKAGENFVYSGGHEERPTIGNVRFISSPRQGDAYVAGEEAVVVEAGITNSRGRPLTVFNGRMWLELEIGDRVRTAAYVPTDVLGSTFRFRYELAADDEDSDGIKVLRFKRSGTIQNRYNRNLWDRDFNLSAASAHKVRKRNHVSFDSASASVREGGRVDLRFNLDPPPAAALAVGYRISEGAAGEIAAGDVTGEVEVPAGAENGRIRIAFPDDAEIGPARETFTVSLSDSGGYVPLRNPAVTVERIEGVCDRTPQVRDALIAATGRGDCLDVTNEDLAGVYILDLDDRRIDALKPNDFLGLGQLTVLNLQNNNLQTLPPGIFEGLTRLGKREGPGAGFGSLRLEGNPAGVFDLTVEVKGERGTGDSREDVSYRLYLSHGSPFDLTVPIEQAGQAAGLADRSLMLARGRREDLSKSISLQTLPNAALEVRLGDLPALPPPGDSGCGRDPCYAGFRFVKPPSLESPDHALENPHYVAPWELTPPRVATVRFTSTSRYPSGYIAGAETLAVEVVFDRRIFLEPSASGGVPSLVLDVGGRASTARYIPASSTHDQLHFRYALKPDDLDEDGVGVRAAGSLRLNGATIEDAFGLSAEPSLADFLGVRTSSRVQRGNLLSFGPSPAPVAEGETAELPFVITPAAWSVLVVGYRVGAPGDTADAADYAAGSGRVGVSPGATSGVVRIPVRDDREIEPPRETFTVQLLASDGYFTASERVTATAVIAEGVCDRTPQVRDALVAALDAADCTAVTSAALSGFGEDEATGTLRLQNQGLTGLKRKDFSGLFHLDRLQLYSDDGSPRPNRLTTLPPGVFSDLERVTYLPMYRSGLSELPAGAFAGLSGLEAIHLGLNPGSPFRLRLEFVVADEATAAASDPVPVRAVLREGAPYRLEIDLNVIGGQVSAPRVEIPAGATRSETFTVTRDPTAPQAVVSFTDLSPPPVACESWQRVSGECFFGFEINSADQFQVTARAADPPLCDRTPGIQEAVLRISTGHRCGDFPSYILPGVSALDASDTGLSGWERTDLNDLTGLGRLDLSDNAALTGLGADAFAGLSSLRRLDLSSGGLRTLHPRAFAGLDNLEQLLLHDNDLRDLPAGIFAGLTGLGGARGSLRLDANPDDDSPGFVFTARFGAARLDAGEAGVFLHLAQGAPFDLSFALTAEGAAASPAPPATLTIPAGSTRSATFTAARRAGETPGETLRLTLGAPPPLPQGNSGCGYAPCYDGFQIRSGPSFVYDGSRATPRATAIEFTSSPQYSDDAYVAGLETLAVDVVFDKEVAVDVSGGAPSLELRVGDRRRTASYVPASDTTARLSFRYALAREDADADGVSVFAQDSLRLNGATVVYAARFHASTSLLGLTDPAAGHKVRRVSLLAFDAASSQVSSVEGETLELGFALTPPPPVMISVAYRIGAPGDTAAAAADYAAAGTVEVPALVESTAVRVLVADDREIEAPRETFTVYLAASDDYFVDSRHATVTIVIREGICDRTPQVRDALMTELGAADCAAVTGEALSGFGEGDAVGILRLQNQGLTSLKQRDFSGLFHLDRLRLYSDHDAGQPNRLTTLPPGVFSDLTSVTYLPMYRGGLHELPAGAFAGLSGLEAMHLGLNPGSPFRLRLSLVFADGAPASASDPAPVRAVLREGAPYRLQADLTVVGGTASVAAVEIPAGATQSETFTVTRDAEASRAVVSFTGLSPPPAACAGWQRVFIDDPDGECFFGFEIDFSDQLLITDHEADPPVCDRTPGIRDAILGLSGGYGCGDFPSYILPGVSSLDAGDAGLSGWEKSDFNGLTGLVRLDLSGNAASTALGAGTFVGLSALRRLDLSSGGLRTLHPQAFAGLEGLEQLLLHDNDLRDLPAGIFAGLAGLGGERGSLRLDANPDDDSPGFILTARFRAVRLDAGEVEVFLHLAQGAPFELAFALSAEGAAASPALPSTLTIPAGSTQSATFTAARNIGETLRLFLGPPPRAPRGNSSCGYAPCYDGFAIASGPAFVYDGSEAAPQVTAVEFTSAPQYLDGAYVAGLETLAVDVVFDKEVVVDVSGGEPSLDLLVGNQRQTASYVPLADSTERLSFRYSFAQEDFDADGVSVFAEDGLRLNGATVWYAARADASTSLSGFTAPATGHAVRRASLLSFDAASSRVSAVEGETLELGFTLSPPPLTMITAAYLVGAPGDTADAADYAAAGTVEILAGAESAAIRISIEDDEDVEPARETLTVRLTASGDSFADPRGAEAVIVIREGVCDRTPQVRDVLVAALGAADCAAVTDAMLAGFGEDTEEGEVTGVLRLQNQGLTGLKQKDFSGLFHLDRLQLYSDADSLRPNRLTTLPPGVFSDLARVTYLPVYRSGLSELSAGALVGLSGLEAMNLGFNPGAPFRLRLGFELAAGAPASSSDPVTVRVVLREGAPYRLQADLAVTGGRLSVSPGVEIAAGATQSETFTVTRDSGASRAEVSFSLVQAAPEECFSWQREAGTCFFGFEIDARARFVVSGTSPDLSPPLCARTQGIQDAILRLASGHRCSDFPAYLLAGVTDLDARDAGLSDLRGSDFNDLASLERLLLGGNRLTTPQASWWAGERSVLGESLAELDLSRNAALTRLGERAFAGLGALRRLELSFGGLKTLHPRAFAGLGSLEQLLLRGNALDRLPTGIFAGLAGLGGARGSLRLDDNPQHGSPGLVLTARFRAARLSTDEIEVFLYVAQGAPFDLSFPLTAEGASSPPPMTLEIPAGSTRSEAFVVTRRAGETLRLSLGDPPALPQGDSGCGYAPCYDGFTIASGAPLVYDGALQAPRVSAVEVTSSPRYLDDGYVAGLETVTVDVAFDQTLIVDVTYGDPSLALSVGNNTRTAAYAPDPRSTNVLSFRYAPTRDDADEDGIGVASADGLRLNGAVVTDAFSAPANTSLESFLAPFAGHAVRRKILLSFDAASSAVSVAETGEPLELGFQLTPPPLSAFVVEYRVGAPGDTARGADYADLGGGRVEVPAEAVSGAIRISILDDEEIDLPREFFRVHLTASADRFVLAPSTATIVIEEGVCDRTPQVRDAVVSKAGLDDCVDVTGEVLAGLDGGLSLADKGIGGLKQKDFSGLTGLNRLELYGNHLETLPPNVFSDLGAVTYLSLWRNPLRVLPENAFFGLSGLEALNVGVGKSFRLRVRLERAGEDLPSGEAPVRATLREGAPYRLNFALFTVPGAALSVNTAVIPAGGTQSETFAVSRAENSSDVAVSFINLSPPPDSCPTWQRRGGRDPSEPCFGGLDIILDARSVLGEDFTPEVSGVTIASTPREGDAYVAGDADEEIVVEVTFSTEVEVTGMLELALEIGEATQFAPLDAALADTTTDRLVFRYKPAVTDRDDDGISIRTDALRFVGDGRIHASGVDVPLTLGVGDYAIENVPGHKVKGKEASSGATDEVPGTPDAPEVLSVTIASSPREGDAYVAGDPAEEIVVEVVLSTAVEVEGMLELALEIGETTRLAVLDVVPSGSSTDRLVFRYSPAVADLDADGISIPTDALRFAGGAGRVHAAGVDAVLVLGAGDYAIENAPGQKVRFVPSPPEVVSVAIISTPLAGDAYVAGDPAEEIVVEVVFSTEVEVSGTLSLTLEIGETERLAALDVVPAGSSTDRLVFRYNPAAADLDADGISIPTGALRFAGGAGRVHAAGVDAVLVLGTGDYAIENAPGQKVRFVPPPPEVVSVAIISTPLAGDAYVAGNPAEEIVIEVVFSTEVEVEGVLELALEIGQATRLASLDAAIPDVAAARWMFRYNPAAADLDADGISIRTDALRFAGGAGRVHAAGVDADLTLDLALGAGDYAIENAPGQKVKFVPPPEVLSVTITSTPLAGDAYVAGDPAEEIVVEVVFSTEVEVSGTLSLTLEIGETERLAASDVVPADSSTDRLVFRYKPAAADLDADGISIPTDALGFADGVGRVHASGVDANLTLDLVLGMGDYVIENAPGQKVEVAPPPPEEPPEVLSVTITSTPLVGDAYVAGNPAEEIVVEVVFSTAVEVEGTLELAIEIGETTRLATLDAPGSATVRLVFRYNPAATDLDADGVSIPPDALRFDGVGRVHAAGVDADLTLDLAPGAGDYAIKNAPGQKVRVAPPPPVEPPAEPPEVLSVAITSTPLAGGAYVAGDPAEEIVVEVTFSTAVEVEGTLELALEIGETTRLATLDAPGSATDRLVFRYNPADDDRDADGISIHTDALRFAGGVGRVHAAGVAADLTLDLVLGAGDYAIENAPGHKVRKGGVRLRIRVFLEGALE